MILKVFDVSDVRDIKEITTGKWDQGRPLGIDITPNSLHVRGIPSKK